MTFQEELEQLINSHSMEQGSNTPDFILAEYLLECLKTFERTNALRESYYGRASIHKKVIIEEITVVLHG